jgi:hypothetical protein
MQDIPKLFTALAEWLSCILLILEYYSGIKNRISAGKILTLLAGGIALAGIQLFCGTVSNVLWLIGMAAAAFEWQIYSYYKPAFSVIFCIIFYVVFFAVCYVAERYLLSLDKGPMEGSRRHQLYFKAAIYAVSRIAGEY